MMSNHPAEPGRPAVNVGLNGFGRIGRQAVRIMTARPSVYRLCHINSTRAPLRFMSNSHALLCLSLNGHRAEFAPC